jgi:RNA polymerase sigma-70 factor (ECF subfamily)
MQGDPAHYRFLRLFAANEPAIHAYVRSLLPTRADAREVMQDVAVVLWQKFGQLGDDAGFRPWAFGVARYAALAYARDKARDRHVFDDDLLATLAAEAAQGHDERDRRQEVLEECLRKLPEPQRELVLTAYTPGTRLDRLAAARGQSAMSLYKVLHRLRLALMECARRTLAKQEPA